jgi:hypothetical protein
MAIDPSFNWQGQVTIHKRQYTCGHISCGREVTSTLGWSYLNIKRTVKEGWIYICPLCRRPTFFDNTEPIGQIPGISFGNDIEHLPEDIENLYREIRNATGCGAFTASVLACRKILKNIALDKGAAVGRDFTAYVEYLIYNHYAPPGNKSWVEKISRIGNEETHEIKAVSSKEAKELVSFVEMLLRFIYEFPAKISAQESS